MTRILHQFVYQAHVNRAKVIEEQIRVVLRPKPRWLPGRLWLWLVSRLIHLERKDLPCHPKTKSPPR